MHDELTRSQVLVDRLEKAKWHANVFSEFAPAGLADHRKSLQNERLDQRDRESSICNRFGFDWTITLFRENRGQQAFAHRGGLLCHGGCYYERMSLYSSFLKSVIHASFLARRATGAILRLMTIARSTPPISGILSRFCRFGSFANAMNSKGQALGT